MSTFNLTHTGQQVDDTITKVRFDTVASLITYLQGLSSLPSTGSVFTVNGRTTAGDTPIRTLTLKDATHSDNGGTIRTVTGDKYLEIVDWDGDVRDFGAGDGVTNDTTAINAAINAKSSGVVFIPNGTYNLVDTINMKSNVSVQCDENTIINGNTISTGSSPVIKFSGSVGTEYNLSVQANENDDTITIASGSFTVGDLVHIVSVKNCLSRTDAGEQWLGDGTAGLSYAYFSEFAVIAEDLGSSQYRISRPLVFDDYKINATGETETQRTASTVKKVTPLENSKWIGGEIRRNSGGNDVFFLEWSYNSSIENCHIVRGSVAGNSVYLAASYFCEVKDVTNTNDPTFSYSYSSHHGTRNRFKTVGSMDCGFDGLKESYGTQSVDFTYSGSYQYSNVRSYCRGGSFNRCFEGLTSHPGCFKEEWTNNVITDCFDDGIVVRGYMPTVSHNIIYSTIDDPNGTGGVENYGVQVAYGGPRRCTVSNNTIRNFYGGVRVLGSSTLEWHYSNVLINISDNEISHCHLGLKTQFSADTIKDRVRFIQYKGNNHSFMGRYVVKLGDYSAGTSITNNTMSGGFRYSGSGGFVAFVHGTQSPMITVQGNTWIRTKNSNSSYTIYMVFLSSITDTTTYPEADWSSQTFIEDNFVTFETTDDVQTVTTSPNYPNLAYGLPDQTTDINGGVIKVLPTKHRVTYCQLDTESDVASDDLDTISAYDNNAFKEGDVLHLRSTTSARNIVIKNQTGNIHTPNNADLTLDRSSSVVSLLYTGSSWAVVSADPMS